MFLLLILSGVNESKVQAEAGVLPVTTDVAGIETKMAEYIEAHQDTDRRTGIFGILRK